MQMPQHTENAEQLVALTDLAKSITPPNEALTSLAKAVEMALHKRFSKEQKDWLSRVGKARKKAAANSKDIELLDGKVTSVGKRFEKTALSQPYGRLLFALMVVSRPLHALELGTGMGSSTMFQGAALEANDFGNMTTIELHEATSKIAEENVRNLGVGRVVFQIGSFQELLAGVLEELGVVSYVFIDGHHQEKPTIAYCNAVLPFMSSSGILVFDDISWSDGMKRAWDTIQRNPAIKVAIDVERMGVCLVSDTIEGHHSFKINME